MVSITQQFQSSELSRASSAVFEAVNESPVRITRRDGDNLILIKESEMDRQQNLLDVAAQIIAISTVSANNAELVSEMVRFFPWMLAFSESEREQCAREIIEHSRISFSLKQPDMVLATISGWKDSAELIARGYSFPAIDAISEPLERPE